MDSKITPVLCSLPVIAGSTVFANTLAPLPTVSDRLAWEKVQLHPAWETVMKLAEQQRGRELEDPFPYYLNYRENGDRQSYEKRLDAIRGFGPLAAAYCATRDKQWLAPIKERIRLLLDLPTWVLPTHYTPLDCHTGKTDVIDINAAALAAELSMLLYLLGDDLDQDLAGRLKDELIRRIVIPWERVMAGNHYIYDWMERKDNWNAVCIGGCTRTFLMLDITPERKERLLKFALRKLANYLEGFGTDGYCSEGINYWYFGYGHFLQLAECIKRCNGKNLLELLPGAKSAAAFPERILIVPGCYPAYADTNADVRNPYFLELRDILLGKRNGFSSRFDWEKNSSLSKIVSILFVPVDEKPLEEENPDRNTVFSQAQVYVARNAEKGCLGVSFKGGNNNEFHNHNDVGSYVVAVGNIPLIPDPGTEFYTARTFSCRRYESRLIGSFGHSVPRIDGKEQTHLSGQPPTGFTGENSAPADVTAAKILRQEFTADRMSVKMDLRAPYNYIPGIKTLERNFHYEWKNGGSFTVTDFAEFEQPMSFEGAVITEGEIRDLGNFRYLISAQGKSLILEFISSEPIRYSLQTIDEKNTGNRKFGRMSFSSVGNIGKIRMEFRYTLSTAVKK